MKEPVLSVLASGWGAPKRGTSLGPSAVLLLRGAELREMKLPLRHVSHTDEALAGPSAMPHAKHLPQVLAFAEQSADHIASLSAKGEVPFVLSGDHSSAAGIIGGLLGAAPQERLGVVWIDAHPDIHSPYTSPSGNLHGMPLAAALGEDYLGLQLHQLEAEEEEAWSRWKGIGKRQLLCSDLVFIGLRSIDPPEAALIEREQIRCFSVEELRNSGVARICDEVCGLLSHCDRVYVSFDVDSVDKSEAPGTGTPVEQGLSIAEARDLNLQLVRQLSGAAKLCAWEMTELNPLLDQQAYTVTWASDIFIAALKASIDPSQGA